MNQQLQKNKQKFSINVNNDIILKFLYRGYIFFKFWANKAGDIQSNKFWENDCKNEIYAMHFCCLSFISSLNWPADYC